MAVMVERKKWILYKHTSSYEIIKVVALDVKNSCKADISEEEKYRMQERLEALNLYKTRNPNVKNLDAMSHKVNTLAYWMFGYKNIVNGSNKFIFSPLGNLFLKYINDDEKTKKIFITMLFAMQFQHPHSKTDKEFQLYPFRLIFKLLSDERLEYKLHNQEMEYLVVFEKTMSEEKYEQLVKNILELRKCTNEDMADKFKEDEHTYVNSVYEWEYYTQTFLESIGLINRVKGDIICKLYHPTKANSKSKPTGRKATTGYITLKDDIKSFVLIMLENYPYLSTPIKLDDKERMRIDCIKEIYNFYPKILLDEIGEPDELMSLFELPKLINEYASNPNNNTAYLFEKVLTEGFDLFYNIKAVSKGGSAHTDIECLYITKNKKFAVEAKSTANKLLGINAGRLREHREEIGGEYTIVIAPRYVPATKNDIKGSPIVIILAHTFAEYLYNNIVHDVRAVDFGDFDSIITQNLGKDISPMISNMTFEKFATSSNLD